MFDVHLFFKTASYGINATYECLQNNLALMLPLGKGDQMNLSMEIS